MGKNVRLANIYIKIYNKCPLTMDDLAFLAKYDPECFEKTCHNLAYNVPEAKALIHEKPEEKSGSQQKQMPAEKASSSMPLKSDTDAKRAQTSIKAKHEKEKHSKDKQKKQDKSVDIDLILDRLKSMERKELDMQDLNVDCVKQLLGTLYMELLFPHNDKDRTFEMKNMDDYSIFNKKA